MLMTIIIVNTDQSSTDGIDFTDNDETLIVQSGIYVFGSTSGAYSNFNNNTLINNGYIFGGRHGVLLYGDSIVINKAGGGIRGYDNGILLDNSTTKSAVINHGRVESGGYGVFIGTNTYGVSLDNTRSEERRV